MCTYSACKLHSVRAINCARCGYLRIYYCLPALFTSTEWIFFNVDFKRQGINYNCSQPVHNVYPGSSSGSLFFILPSAESIFISLVCNCKYTEWFNDQDCHISKLSTYMYYVVHDTRRLIIRWFRQYLLQYGPWRSLVYNAILNIVYRPNYPIMSARIMRSSV